MWHFVKSSYHFLIASIKQFHLRKKENYFLNEKLIYIYLIFGGRLHIYPFQMMKKVIMLITFIRHYFEFSFSFVRCVLLLWDEVLYTVCFCLWPVEQVYVCHIHVLSLLFCGERVCVVFILYQLTLTGDSHHKSWYYLITNFCWLF